MHSDERQPDDSRRAFLRSSGSWLGAAWVAAHWPAIAAAAEAARRVAQTDAPVTYEFLHGQALADIEVIAAQIVPSGPTPGAREAQAIVFIDRALARLLPGWAAEFRAGYEQFHLACTRAHDGVAFARLDEKSQQNYLTLIESSAFFDTVRTLTLLGMFSSPQYGGNHLGAGWALLGFEDRHAFTPPFGYYDRDYPGFAPPAAAKS